MCQYVQGQKHGAETCGGSEKACPSSDSGSKSIVGARAPPRSQLPSPTHHSLNAREFDRHLLPRLQVLRQHHEAKAPLVDVLDLPVARVPGQGVGHRLCHGCRLARCNRESRWVRGPAASCCEESGGAAPVFRLQMAAALAAQHWKGPLGGRLRRCRQHGSHSTGNRRRALHVKSAICSLSFVYRHTQTCTLAFGRAFARWAAFCVPLR